MTYTLDPLPYAYNALEPFIDEKTMQIHHAGHHKTYVDKLNTTLEKYPELQKKSEQELLISLSSLPKEIQNQIKNFAGGVVNHNFFFSILKKSTKPSGKILEAINKKFGNFDKFKEEFTKQATGLFGSGWTWLVLNNKELEIVNLPNQDSPLSQNKTPLLTIDMWEHAYYLKHQNKKANFIEDFFNIINWEKVEEIYSRTI